MMSPRGVYRPFAMMSLIIAVVFITGCIDEEEDGDSILTDQTGNPVEIEGTPERIVALAPSLCDILLELDSEELLVGADSASVMENEDLDLATVATYSGLDSERLVEVSPDLVLMDKNLDISDENYNMIKSLSIPVYRAFPNDLEDVWDMIEDIGRIVDKESEAAGIIDNMMIRLETVETTYEDVPLSEKPSVVYVTYYDGTADPYVGTSSGFSGDVIELAGGVNSIHDSSNTVIQISVERIIEADPDVIITSQSSQWPTNSRETILSDPAWDDITAVKKDEVHDIDGNYIDRTGPGLIVGIESLNLILYS